METELANLKLQLSQANDIVEDFRKRLQKERENHSNEV